MKKILISLAVVLLAIVMAFSVQIKQALYPEKTVTKAVTLTMVNANCYRSRIYANSTAMLNVTVIRLRGRQMDTLFVKDYPKFKLSSLASYSKGFNESIHVPGVFDKKEKIILVYNITYNTKESLLVIPTVTYIESGTTNDRFSIII